MKFLGFFIYFHAALGVPGSILLGIFLDFKMGWPGIIIAWVCMWVCIVVAWGGIRMSSGEPFLMWKK